MIRAIIILNERALRFVYQDKISTYETLVVKNGYSALGNQRLAIGNRNIPTSISGVIDGTTSNYNLRGDAILKLPKVNLTKYGIKSWRYQAARQWNTIPNNLRNIYTLFDGFAYNTCGYFASCVVFFRAPQGRGKTRAMSKMSARIIC